MIHKRTISLLEARLLLAKGLGYSIEGDTAWVTMPVDPHEIDDFKNIMLKWAVNKDEGIEDPLGDVLAEVYRVEVV